MLLLITKISKATPFLRVSQIHQTHQSERLTTRLITNRLQSLQPMEQVTVLTLQLHKVKKVVELLKGQPALSTFMISLKNQQRSMVMLSLITKISKATPFLRVSQIHQLHGLVLTMIQLITNQLPLRRMMAQLIVLIPMLHKVKKVVRLLREQPALSMFMTKLKSRQKKNMVMSQLSTRTKMV